jgi:hypothetical protein
MYNRWVVFMMLQDDPNCVQSLLLRHLLLAVAAAWATDRVLGSWGPSGRPSVVHKSGMGVPTAS